MTRSTIIAVFLLYALQGYAADPFSEQVTAEKTAIEKATKTKEDEMARIKEENSITVPDDLLVKMDFREWTLPIERHQSSSFVGKLKKIYFVQYPQQSTPHTTGGNLLISQVMLVAKDGSIKELSSPVEFNNPNNWHSPDTRYIQLVVERLYHGNLRLPWQPESNEPQQKMQAIPIARLKEIAVTGDLTASSRAVTALEQLMKSSDKLVAKEANDALHAIAESSSPAAARKARTILNKQDH